MKTPRHSCIGSGSLPRAFVTLALFVALLVGPGRSITFAATATWNGASGTDFNWSSTGNWTPAGVPGVKDAVFFNDEGAASGQGEGYPNNILSTNHTVTGLTYGNTNGFHNTILSPGVTLTISNNAADEVLYVGTGANNTASRTVTATISGTGGRLVVVSTNAGSRVHVRQASASNGSHRATLDLYGLDAVELTVGQLLVGAEGVTAYNRPQGTLILAKTNIIRLNGSAPALNVGDCNGSAGTNYVELGLTNALFTDSLTIGRQKCGGTLRFNPWYAGWEPVLFLRGATGDRVSAMVIGDNSGQTTSSVGCFGMVDLSMGALDAFVDTCYIARGLSGNGTGQADGTLTFDKGLLDVNTLRVGYLSIGTAKANVTGAVNVNGTAILVINDTLQLGNHVQPATALVSSTLTIANDGAVRANSITRTIGDNVSARISMAGGTLIITNSAGSAEAPLASAEFSGATLTLPIYNNSTNIFTKALLGAGNTINIMSLPIVLAYPARYPLLSYSSGSFDAQVGTLPAAIVPYHGHIENNPATLTIDLVITDGPPPPQQLTWSGTPNGNWDTATPNWLTSGNPTPYRQLDKVTFDDTAAGTTTVNLTTTLTPTDINVNNTTKPYTITGPGSLSGANGVVKEGTGTLTIANSGSNDFVGGVTINAGTLKIGGSADRLPVYTDVALADRADAVLDLNNLNQTLASISGGGAIGGNVSLGSGTLTLAGSGVYAGRISGSGMLIKTEGGVQVLAGDNLHTGGTIVTAGRLSVANATGSGTGTGFVRVETNGTFSVGAGGVGGSIAAPVITNNGIVRFDRSDDFTQANSIAGWGSVVKVNTNTLLIPISNTYTGATTISQGPLRVSHPEALGATTGQTSFGSAIDARLEIMGNITLLEPIRMVQKGTAAGMAPVIVNVSGTNTLAGQIEGVTGGSYWTLRPDEGRLVVSGVFTNATTSGNRYLRLLGGASGDWQTDYCNNTTGTSINHLLKDDVGTWTLSGNNTYGGITYVAGGLLLVNGSIQNSSSVLVTNGALGGTGVIHSPVTVGAEGRLAPGVSIGTLVISNALTLNGVTEMDVSATGADQVTGLTVVQFGGLLKVKVSGTLNGTEVFRLFEAGGYTGDFAQYDLPALNPPLTWDYSSVYLDGTLRVLGGVQKPQFNAATRTSDGNVQLTGTGADGASYRILATTDLAQPLDAWTQVGSGSFQSGAFSFNDLNATNYAVRFYNVVTP